MRFSLRSRPDQVVVTAQAAATLLRTLALQAFLAGTTAFIAADAADPTTALAAHLVLKQFYLARSPR